jgi:hypothetical protein
MRDGDRLRDDEAGENSGGSERERAPARFTPASNVVQPRGGNRVIARAACEKIARRARTCDDRAK